MTYETRRPPAARRGYTRRWNRFRKVYLAGRQCVACHRPATDLDHITPVKSASDPRFWDLSNLQALCHGCHSRKTRQDARSRAPLRHDDPRTLDLFRRGLWPPTLDGMFQLVASEFSGEVLLDLGCASGLLAERLRRSLGIEAIGLDLDPTLLDAGRRAGVQADLVLLPVRTGTLDRLETLLRDRTVAGISIRQTWQEIVAADQALGFRLATLFAETGVRQIFLMGSRRRGRPSSIVDDVAFFADRYETIRLAEPYAYLRLAPSRVIA